MKNKRYGHPTRVTIRFHDEEIKHIDKKRKKDTRSNFIRNKTLVDLTKENTCIK